MTEHCVRPCNVICCVCWDQANIDIVHTTTVALIWPKTVHFTLHWCCSSWCSQVGVIDFSSCTQPMSGGNRHNPSSQHNLPKVLSQTMCTQPNLVAILCQKSSWSLQLSVPVVGNIKQGSVDSQGSKWGVEGWGCVGWVEQPVWSITSYNLLITSDMSFYPSTPSTQDPDTISTVSLWYHAHNICNLNSRKLSVASYYVWGTGYKTKCLPVQGCWVTLRNRKGKQGCKGMKQWWGLYNQWSVGQFGIYCLVNYLATITILAPSPLILSRCTIQSLLSIWTPFFSIYHLLFF